MKHLVRTDRSIYISIEYLIRRSKKTTASIRSKKYNSQTKTPKQQLKFFTLRHSHSAMFLTKGGRGTNWFCYITLYRLIHNTVKNTLFAKSRYETYLIPGETQGEGKRFTLVLDTPHI